MPRTSSLPSRPRRSPSPESRRRPSSHAPSPRIAHHSSAGPKSYTTANRSPRAGRPRANPHLLPGEARSSRTYAVRVDSQWREVVRASGGPLVVVGTAGSGKTTLIAERFRWLVQQGSDPERIAVVAPSEGRADGLRARIESGLARGYEELHIGTPLALSMHNLGAVAEPPLTAGDRLAMLLERIDELSLAHHDFGGSPSGLLGRFVRRIDRLKAELIGAEPFAAWAAEQSEAEREFAEVYRTHERMLAAAGARDGGDLVRDALGKLERGPADRFEHVLVDDAQELDFAAASLVRSAG